MCTSTKPDNPQLRLEPEKLQSHIIDQGGTSEGHSAGNRSEGGGILAGCARGAGQQHSSDWLTCGAALGKSGRLGHVTPVAADTVIVGSAVLIVAVHVTSYDKL